MPLPPFFARRVCTSDTAAATAALREELTRDYPVTEREIDEAYAVSRITPGTNLLALYAQTALCPAGAGVWSGIASHVDGTNPISACNRKTRHR
jgi:hypothetical protein